MALTESLGFSKSRVVKMPDSADYYEPTDFPDYLVGMDSIYEDLFSHTKGFRSQLVAQISKHLKLEKDVVKLLQKTVEFIHSASLLHDDLIDCSSLRRSKTTAWLKYSPEYAVLSGDYLMASVMKNLSEYGNLKMVQYTAEMALCLIEGEWIQDTTLKDWDLDIQELDRIYNLKTGSLFRWCLNAPFICKGGYPSEVHEVLNKVGGSVGILFQRSDDLIDFGVRNDGRKSILSDLRAGYLNSFGIFLFKRVPEEKHERIRKCTAIEDVYNIVGEDEFQQVVKEFDDFNKELICECEGHLDKLLSILKKEESGLIADLKMTASVLYWRKPVC